MNYNNNNNDQMKERNVRGRYKEHRKRILRCSEIFEIYLSERSSA